MRTAQIVDLLIESARNRAMTASELATACRCPLRDVYSAFRELGELMRPGYGDRMPVGPEISADRAIVMLSRAAAAASPEAGCASTSIAFVHVPDPDVLAWCLAHLPTDVREAAWVRVWFEEHGGAFIADRLTPTGDARGPTSPSAGYVPPGTPGTYRSSPSHQWFEIIGAGDTPSELAYWITGDSTANGYVALMDANPEKPTTGTRGTWNYNFKSLLPGENIKLPKAWNQYISEAGFWGSKGVPYPEKPGGGPIVTPKDPGGNVWAASLPDGAIAAIKIKLGGWGLAEKTILDGYPSPLDLNDVIDEEFVDNVRKFQQWSNARGTALRTDGVIDKTTNDALDAYVKKKANVDPNTDPPPIVVVGPGTDLYPDIVTPGGTAKWDGTKYVWTPTTPGGPIPATVLMPDLPDPTGNGGRWIWDGSKYVYQAPGVKKSSGGGEALAALAAAALLAFKGKALGFGALL